MQIIGGFTGGFLYVAETTAMLSYPDLNDRGIYLGKETTIQARFRSLIVSVRDLVRYEKLRQYCRRSDQFRQ